MSVPNNRNAAGPGTRRNVFISYRVKDTGAATGRLADSLKQRLEEDQIFMDIDKLEPGVDFTEVISRSLDACDVMLAVIGPDWTGYNAETKRSRIQDPNDWVRLELATALKRNIRVVPVLVDGGVLPDSAELPEELQPLLRRQTYEISNKRWKYDTDQLIVFLEQTCGIYGKKTRPQPQPAMQPAAPAGKGVGNVILKIFAGIIACIVVLAVIGFIVGDPDQKKKDDEQHPVQPQPDPQPVYNNNGANNSNGNGSAPVSNTDISGRWQDPVNTGIFVFQQNGSNLQLVTYSQAGEQTGSGTGFINGRKIQLNVNLMNVAQVVLEATVQEGNQEIKGHYNMQQNGAAYTEEMRLVR